MIDISFVVVYSGSTDANTGSAIEDVLLSDVQFMFPNLINGQLPKDIQKATQRYSKYLNWLATFD